jgi:hypothetical protein
MKAFITGLMLLSSSAFATSYSANEALLKVLPAGEYTGSTEGEKNPCLVTVEDNKDSVLITASANGRTKKSLILDNGIYNWNPGQRYFLHTSRQSGTENIFRTIAVTESTQYIVVADRRTNESKIECVIKL